MGVDGWCSILLTSLLEDAAKIILRDESITVNVHHLESLQYQQQKSVNNFRTKPGTHIAILVHLELPERKTTLRTYGSGTEPQGQNSWQEQ